MVVADLILNLLDEMNFRYFKSVTVDGWVFTYPSRPVKVGWLKFEGKIIYIVHPSIYTKSFNLLDPSSLESFFRKLL